MNTDIKEIKNIVKYFLQQRIEKTEYSPMIVIHPIFETSIIPIIEKDGNFTYKDMLQDKEALQIGYKQTEKRINEATTLTSLYCIIRKSYRLTLLKFARPYLSVEDFSSLLANAWTTSENPNTDINVDIATLSNWFQTASKKFLMTIDEYNAYRTLPDRLTIYRGVASKSNPKGLSWTTDIKKAEWFANRWNDKGYIIQAEIPKDKVLAYFTTRGEQEVVVDTTDVQYERRI